MKPFLAMAAVVLLISYPGLALSDSSFASADERAPVANARIVAIRGHTVTIESQRGTRSALQLKSTTGLKVGQLTSWCEEDCRVLHVWTEYQVQKVATPQR
jgi:hypothetical protein